MPNQYWCDLYLIHWVLLKFLSRKKCFLPWFLEQIPQHWKLYFWLLRSQDGDNGSFHRPDHHNMEIFSCSYLSFGNKSGFFFLYILSKSRNFKTFRSIFFTKFSIIKQFHLYLDDYSGFLCSILGAKSLSFWLSIQIESSKRIASPERALVHYIPPVINGINLFSVAF